MVNNHVIVTFGESLLSGVRYLRNFTGSTSHINSVRHAKVNTLQYSNERPDKLNGKPSKQMPWILLSWEDRNTDLQHWTAHLLKCTDKTTENEDEQAI